MKGQPPWWKQPAPIPSKTSDTGQMICRNCGALNTIHLADLGRSARWQGKTTEEKLAHGRMINAASRAARLRKKALGQPKPKEGTTPC